MTIEAATYINQLNALYPEGGADRATADDHLRLIKATVLATFPNITGPVTVTQAALNLNAGNTKTLTTYLSKYSLSISANTADIAKLSLSVSAVVADVARISLSVSAVIAAQAADAVRINTLSISVSVVQAALASVSAVLVTSLNSVSVVVMASIRSTSAAVVTAFPNTERTWGAQQVAMNASISDSTSIGWDCDVTGQIAAVTLGGVRTMLAPTNISPNASYVLVVRQDATGSRSVSFNAAFLFPGGIDPTFSPAANAVDILTFIGGTNVMYCIGQAKGLA